MQLWFRTMLYVTGRKQGADHNMLWLAVTSG